MIALQILKIAGFVLAGIAALVLLILILVLFLPFRYRLAGCGKNEDINAEASVKWILGFVTVKAVYAAKRMDYYVRVAGIKILKGNLIGDEKPEKEEKPKEKPEKKKEPKEKLKFPENIKAFWNGLKEKWEKVKTAKYIVSAPVTERAWKYVKSRLFRLLGSIRPRSLKGRAEFGTGDPAQTAEIYGAGAVFAEFIDNRFMLVPDMENKIIDIDMSINGRIFVGLMLLLVLQIITNKDVRRVIRYTKKNF